MFWLSDETERGENEEEGWAFLPDPLLEEIFSTLPLRNRFRAGLVCLNWNRIFLSHKIWETYIYRDLVFTRRKFTIHAGWQYAIDHWKLRFLIRNAGRKWRHLIIKPVTILYNLYEFIRAVTNFTEYYLQSDHQENPLENVRSFDFDWKLHTREWVGEKAQWKIHGTGGEMLESIRLLLSHFSKLDMLALRHLLLDTKDADEFMDSLFQYFGQTLTSLCILNLTRKPHCFMHLGLFLNLRKLCISPAHLDEDIVYLLSSNPNMRDLVLIQDDKSSEATGVNGRAWREARKQAPKFRVHLRMRGRTRQDLVFQDEAPVASIVLDTPFVHLQPNIACTIVDNYSNYLETYVQRGWQRRYLKKTFEDRADESVIMLVRNCKKLTTLGIRERISTATVLLAAQLVSERKPFYLCVRRNALLKRCDWPPNALTEFSTGFYHLLKESAKDYDRTNAEVSRIFGTQWSALTDNEYLHRFLQRGTMLFS